MEFEKIELNPPSAVIQRRVDEVVNTLVRGYDEVMGRLHLGGRKGDYDDIHYEFNGGAKDQLRKKHYDKSMRLLWKAEDQAPWLGFRDCTTDSLRAYCSDSNAPTSQAGPCGRATPRWSSVSGSPSASTHAATGIWSMATLSGPSACVKVGPP